MKNICVFCGSNPGKNPQRLLQAYKVGEALAKRKLRLIYGASNLGLMGQVAKAVLDNNGEVIGIMPEIFASTVEQPDLSELIITKDMKERKALMLEKADGFITLPGGFGTLEEFFEMITLNQIGYHKKPSAILNIDGFYDKLLEFIDQLINEGFIRPAHRAALIVSDSIEEILDKMEKYKNLHAEKWINA